MATRESETTPSAPPAPAHPLEGHNLRLLEQVHPPGWRNPEPRERYHLVVVGAGTGGLVTAAIAASLGARVALVERALMGGDCLNAGCVPSKALLRAARAWEEARRGAERFGAPPVAGPGSFERAMERMRRIRAEISPVDGAPRFRDELGVDVFLGEGRFVSPEALEVDGARLRFRRAVIATGARPAVPPIPGLREAGFLTSETLFSLTERPESLVVVGAGPIGCEMAQAFARFGTRVTLLDAAARVLPCDDPDASRVVAEALRRDGVEIAVGVMVQGVERTPGGARTVRWSGAEGPGSATATHLLVAVGRAPSVEGLGLDAAGVEHGRSGVGVDARLRTSNRRIYAVGDVASRLHLTHAADAQARLVVRNALFFGRGRADRLLVPRVTYTSPEVAHVGLTAEEAREQGDAVETLTLPMREVDRARLDGEEAGFLRVHLRAGSDRILGATLVGAHAGEIISQVTQAMTAGIGLEKVGEAVFPYPTQAEVLRKAADAWRRRRLTPRAQWAFGSFFRLFR